jgi:C-terminal processing protease CtpA/Prc
MKALLFLCLFGIAATPATAQNTTPQQFREDYTYFWQTIKDNYSFWHKKTTNWNRVQELYKAGLDTITTRRSFVSLLELTFYELYDHHASLNTNTQQSQRLVPSGTDVWAEYVDGKPLITEVRHNYGAWKAGVRPGMEVVAVNGVTVGEALKPFYPKALTKEDIEARNYALRVLLAGCHSDKRTFTLKDSRGQKDYTPDAGGTINDYGYTGHLESKVYEGGIGYLRINNSLGNNDLIPLFDSVLNTLMNTSALILDLRETPGGGNTTVARAILGRFITKEGFYQAHELTAEGQAYGIKRSWKEIVSPRKNPYTKPLVVLVNHWTGSVGEGIAIGFDALKRATIIGTRMAGLNGANYSYQMPNTKIGFSFPAEKLFHVGGIPRESFVPPVLVKPTASNRDEILDRALQHLKGRK